MNGAARNEGHVARAHVVPDTCNLDIETTFQKEEGLVLPVVDMKARADTRLNNILEDGHRPPWTCRKNSQKRRRRERSVTVARDDIEPAPSALDGRVAACLSDLRTGPSMPGR